MPGVSCQRNSGPRIPWSKNNLNKHLEVSKEVNLGLLTFNMQRDEFEHILLKTTFILLYKFESSKTIADFCFS